MRASLPLGPAIAVVSIAGVLLLGCGDADADNAGADPPATSITTSSSTTSTTSTAAPTTAPTTTTTTAPVVVEVNETSFVNLADMSPVRGFFVDNLLGDLDATLAVAENLDGGVYPAGSVVQLFPGEAMVKREAGFSPDTNDWEFFELVPSADGTEIRVRGGAETINQFGGSCADCHQLAEPQFDLICEQNHGCEALPIGRDLIELAQNTDPRPRLDG